MSRIEFTGSNGQKFLATASQAEALESLSQARAGGIATVYGYVSKSAYVAGKPAVYDMQFLSRFSTKRLYERKIAALSDITLSDIRGDVAKDPVLSKLSDAELATVFNDRKASEVASLANTVSDDADRSDAHRQAHDRCYATVAEGVRVHFVTAKDGEGKAQPVLENGLPVVKSIMVNVLQLNKTVREAGEIKVVNSKAPVRISNILKKHLNLKSVGFKALSLGEDNFERLVVARKSYLPEDVAGIPSDILAD